MREEEYDDDAAGFDEEHAEHIAALGSALGSIIVDAVYDWLAELYRESDLRDMISDAVRTGVVEAVEGHLARQPWNKLTGITGNS